ncbi:MAG: flagellar filament capping protein FliD [Gammaproteobacteria bacterium]
MGTIVSSGVGSGLDVNGLVTKLVAAEGAPTSSRLDQQEAKIQGKISALGTLRAALAKFQTTVAALQTTDKFQGRQVVLSSQDFLSATSDSSSVPGSYQVEVQQLASAQKLQSGPFAAGSTVVGTGTLQIAIGGQTYPIDVDSTNNTLAGIAKAINASAVGSKVVATVISGATEARLTIAGRDTGLANAMTITQSGGDGGLATLTYPPSGGSTTQLNGALDARVLVDGVLATSATNSITGAIAGVTLNAADANDTGETTTVTVSYNRTATQKTVTDFVTSYNAVVDAVKSVASYNASTQQGGPLFGDTGVLNIADQLRRILTSAVPGADPSADMLADIGVSSGLDGKYTINSTKLNAALDTNFDAVGKLFAADKVGVAVKLGGLLDQYLGSSGLFDARTATLNATVKDIADQRTALNARLTVLQARYTKQFNALDTLLSQMQSTSAYLTQQLASLPGYK